MNNFIINTLLYYYHDIKTESDPNLEYLSDIGKYVTFNCNIVDTFKDNYGKESGDDENIIIMEQEYFYKYLSNFIPEEIINYFPDYPNYIKIWKEFI